MKNTFFFPSFDSGASLQVTSESLVICVKNPRKLAEDLAPLFICVGQLPITALATDILQTFLLRQESLVPTTYKRRLAALRSFTQRFRDH